MSTTKSTDSTKATDVTAEMYVGDLHHLWRQAGEPSFSKMTEAMGRSKSTWWRALNGKNLPRWEVVADLLDVCGARDEDIDEFWRPRWVAAQGFVRPGREQPESDGSLAVPAPRTRRVATVPSTTCPECGLVVGDAALHDRWHRVQRAILGQRVPQGMSNGSSAPRRAY